MKRFYFLLLFITAFYVNASSQKQKTLKGIAFDSLANQPVANATVTVLNKKDSALVSFTMTDNAGLFEITGIENGEYRLLISHINYHNKTIFFAVKDERKDLGRIIMYDRAKILDEVIVNGEAPPVTLIGDTVQYNAGSFKTAPNANVEDLLKKLPGVKVDKDGTVKAQGEKVQKVLVDGKEFFGNDPKIATKNLPADAIDKVQVYDKLSDQAQLTGFDDGNSEKTINLKLKKDKKKGYFGKVNAGAGDDGRYQGKFNVNSFKGARQLSAIGMDNNTNAEGFSFMDILSFTGAMNQLKNGGGNININISDDDPIAGLLGANNTGINTTFGGGVNYNNIIGTKTDFQSNYFYSRYNPVKENHIQRQYFLPVNLYTQNSYTDNLNNNHRLNFSADYQIDSFHSIKISPSLSYQKTTNNTISDYTTLSENGILTNDGKSNNLSNNEGYNFSTAILFRKKFKRKGRTFSFNLLTNLNDNNGNGSLQSITSFYDAAGSLMNRDSINQKNNNANSLGGYNAKAVYTEPIFKKSLLEFSLGNSYSRNNASKTTHDYNANSGKFDLINNLFTNRFESNYGYTNAGLRLRKQTKTYNYSIGTGWQHAELEGKIFSGGKDSVITKEFSNVLPNARFQYYFSRFKNLMLNYSTNTNQPTVAQLQPVPDNSNPLYVKLGNPNLKQEFTHVLRLNVSLVNPYKNRNVFVFFTFQETQNKIVNADHINSLGVDSVMPVNANGVYNMNGSISWGYPVHFLKGTLELSSNVNSYRGKQFINDRQNNIQTLTLGPEVRLDMNPTEKLNVSVNAGLNYSRSNYSLQSARSTRYFTQTYGTDINWQLPKLFFLATDFTYRINNQHADGFNAKVPLWNASISKQMLRFNRGEIKFSVNDLLNQNIGINRTSNQNYIEDSRINNLRRFFLLSFTYSLTKTGLNNAGNGGGVRVITR
jgi:Outer membrane protein beta-barrel family/Carboxypeptidase regulatory-like domain